MVGGMMVSRSSMKRRSKKSSSRRVQPFIYIVVSLLGVGFYAGIAYLITKTDVFNPAGVVAHQEKDLIIFTTALGMAVVIPVFIMLFAFSWKYREGNTKATYRPNASSNRFLETLWWGIPIAIITVLGVVAVVSSHQLDPRKTVASDQQPIRVQVVTLQWRWLFLYPDYHVASLDKLTFPEKTPVDFELTADAPMSTFWIPKLGGQIYTMPGMSSRLSLMADHTGDFRGTNTNINGTGYASMDFTASAVSNSDFHNWVTAATQAEPLTTVGYSKLAQPSHDNVVKDFSLPDAGLYDTIIGKYMGHNEGVTN